MPSTLAKFDVACPSCRFVFLPGKDSPHGGTSFQCPQCGETLTYEVWGPFPFIHFFVSLLLGVGVYYLGFRGWILVVLIALLSLLTFAFGVSIIAEFRGSRAKVATGIRPFDMVELKIVDAMRKMQKPKP